MNIKKGILLRTLLICWLLAVTSASAYADLLRLAPGAEMTIQFSIPNWSSTNSTAALPAQIGLQLLGLIPDGSPTLAIPGSTGKYYSGFLLNGWIKSLDGRVSAPLFDANAARLGLLQGSLVAEALYGGGAAIEGDAYLSPSLALSLFGKSGQGMFLIQNLGKSVTIGLGDGYSIGNAVIAPITTSSYLQTAGLNQQIQVSVPVPEPALWGAVAAGFLLLFVIQTRRGRRAATSQVRGQSE